MIKTLLSPLFLATAAMLVGLLYLRLRSLRKSRGNKHLLNLLLLITLLFWAVSTPFAASRLAELWEREQAGMNREKISQLELDAVTVLSGGIYRGFNESMDLPGDGTVHRVYRGVEVYQKSGADLLIMQGRLSEGHPERMVELMQAQAEKMGVSEKRIELEPDSRNTREHPLELLELEGVDSDLRLGVVTSAWHLRRAEIEFSRYFNHITAIPAEFISQDNPGGIKDFMPRVYSLRTSTRIFHEIIGMQWYRVINRLSQ